MGSLARAELVADGGAAAADTELFRSAAFLEAEGATHTLRLSSPDRTALVPLIVREIEGSGSSDAVSPYGYPGGGLAGTGATPNPDEVDWTACGLVSIFARERLAGPAWLGGARERSTVQIHDPSRPRQLRARLAEQIRANERGGWAVRTLAGPAAPGPDRDSFALAYEQTMRRAGAAPRYFFEREYLDAVLSYERSWLLVAERGGDAGAAAIAAISDNVLHYYLGGTADSARDESPFKNVVAAMLDLADELELKLNLGGGVSPGDGLEAFKRGFANSELAFRTHELVCDPAEYDRLAGGRPASGAYFPAYR